jgi:hypothetical protein
VRPEEIIKASLCPYFQEAAEERKTGLGGAYGMEYPFSAPLQARGGGALGRRTGTGGIDMIYRFAGAENANTAYEHGSQKPYWLL